MLLNRFRGVFRGPLRLGHPLEVKNVLKFNVKKIMLNFDLF